MGESLPVLTRLKHKKQCEQRNYKRYEVLTAVTTKMTLFCDVTPYSLVDHHPQQTLIFVIHAMKTTNVAQ
jgi:hypothetical protein